MLDSIIRAASRLPVESLHRLTADLRPLARLTYRRRVVRRNLALAFPDADTAALVDGFYTALAQVCAEVVHSLSMSADELRERVVFEGAQALDGGDAVLLMAHHGNLVWAATALAGAITAPLAVVYKPPHVAALGELLVAIAERFQVTAVPVPEVRRQLLGSRQKHTVWTLVADQRPPRRERQYARLCGRQTAFFTGPGRIARALGWPVYYLSCQRTGAGRYHCRIEKLAEPPYSADASVVVENYAARLQADIDQAPADWLWSHTRWRGD